MNVANIVLEKLITWKNEGDISSRELANRLEVTEEKISKYLNKVWQIPNTRFQQIANMMNISLDDLLKGEEPYTVHLHGKISSFSGRLGVDRVISKIEENYSVKTNLEEENK